MKLSIVTTLYLSASFIPEFYTRVKLVVEGLTDNYEIIFVDDGSPDDSLRVACEIAQLNPSIQVVELSRNFGHHAAMMTGLQESTGDLVFLIDSDLEESPEMLTEFYESMLEEEVDIVIGVQSRRKGGMFERLSGHFFYSVFNHMSPVKIPLNFITARLMTRQYVNALIRHKERELFFAGLCALTGFRQYYLKVEKGSKRTSTYSLVKKITLAVQAITSFSARPLYYIFYLGLVLICCSVIYSFYVAIISLVHQSSPGFASIIISIWLIGGITFVSIGILGSYLARIYMEVKQRPYSIIRSRYQFCEKDSEAEAQVCNSEDSVQQK